MKKEHVLLTEANIASIRDIQRSPSQALKGITRVMRGSKTIGFFFPLKDMDGLLDNRRSTEDMLVAAIRAGTLED